METTGQGRGNAKARALPILGAVAILLVMSGLATVAEGVQHQVGGTPGWSIPSRSQVNYTEWASTQSFKVGDILYFNYSSAYHDVMEVSKEQYENCDATSPKLQWADGADYIPLNTSGTFYYICGIPGHCEAGQKVALTVATNGTRHQVGGPPGWSLPARSNVNYTAWASTQTFLVNDLLYFNYSSAFHNVLQVTASSYDACNATDPIHTWDDGETLIPLNSTGTFYYICGVPGHCEAGQKVAVTVVGSSSGSSQPGAESAPGPSPAPSAGAAGPSSAACSLRRHLGSLQLAAVALFISFVVLAY